MILYTVSMNSPDVVKQLLIKQNFSNVKILKIGGTVSDDIVCDILMVCSYGDFISNFQRLKSDTYTNLKVILFASSSQTHGIHPKIPLDGGDVSDNYKPSRVKISLLKEPVDDPEEILVEDNYLVNLIDSIRSDSILNGLMTWVYSLPSTAFQQKVKNNIIDWFFTGYDFENLITKLQKLDNKKKVSKASILELQELLYKDISLKYLSAFRHIGTKKNINLEEVARTYEVAVFELRYCVEIYRKNNE